LRLVLLTNVSQADTYCTLAVNAERFIRQQSEVYAAPLQTFERYRQLMADAGEFHLCEALRQLQQQIWTND